MAWDLLIRGGRWFDGGGGPSAVRDVGIRDGRVAAVSAEPLDADGCPQVIDAAGQWVLPGFIDIHTHYDAEVLLAPALTESVRHGVTTVVFGSCSLGTVHVGPVDAADLFSRVEAVPREQVIRAREEHGTWGSAGEYVAALEALPLGPNVTAFLGHSDLRAAVMGLGRSTDRRVTPSPAELRRMRELLADAWPPASSACRRCATRGTSWTGSATARARCRPRTPPGGNTACCTGSCAVRAGSCSRSRTSPPPSAPCSTWPSPWGSGSGPR